jgi:hypothetical protein
VGMGLLKHSKDGRIALNHAIYVTRAKPLNPVHSMTTAYRREGFWSVVRVVLVRALHVR